MSREPTRACTLSLHDALPILVDGDHAGGPAQRRDVDGGLALAAHEHGKLVDFPVDLKARLEIDGKVYELPVLVGSEGETAIDITSLRGASGVITIDQDRKSVV